MKLFHSGDTWQCYGHHLYTILHIVLSCIESTPSDDGLLAVVERLPGELWMKLSVSLGVPVPIVNDCVQRGRLGMYNVYNSHLNVLCHMTVYMCITV